MSRPEHIAPPEIFYNATESTKYTQNTRIISIQSQMSLRALQLLALPPTSPAFLLDIGCGSGLSGQILEDNNHVWVGLDVSPDMLDVALDRGVDGDLFLSDIGQGVAFRPGTFDGAISVSVIQWLCNADKSSHVPRKRLLKFFSTLYSSLTRGARAVFQFYPENPSQIEMIVTSATKAGFLGGLVIDYPNSSKAKKYFLCLFAGYTSDDPKPELPAGLCGDEEETSVKYANGRERVLRRRKSGKAGASGLKVKDWVIKKKELARVRGKQTASDSKFTARSRKPRF